MIKTDFGGRSFDFEMGEGLPDYLPTIEAMHKAMGHYAANPSEPELVADVVWRAVTDESHTLRYRAGADADALLDARKEQSDSTFIADIKKNMGW